MAKWSNTKILKKATPTVRLSDGVVKKWEIEVVYTEPTSGWTRSYPHTEDDLEYLGKKPEQFTKDQLIALMPSVMDEVFSSHYDGTVAVPTEEKVANFDLSTLGATTTTTTSSKTSSTSSSTTTSTS